MINFGSEQVVQAGGKSYRLDKLRLKHIRAFRDWVSSQVGDPFAEAERFIGSLPPAEATKLIAEARLLRDQLQSFSMFGELGLRFLMTEEGVWRVSQLLLQRYHCGGTEKMTEDEIDDVAEVVADRIVDVLRKAMGQLPNGQGPAGETPPAASTGTPSTGAPGWDGPGPRPG